MKFTLALSLLAAQEAAAGTVRRTAGHECMTIGKFGWRREDSYLGS